MDWDCDVTVVSDRAILLPLIFDSPILAIKIEANNYRPTWYKAGYLQSFVAIEGESFLGTKYNLSFSPQLIQIPYRNYQLQFEPVIYAENARIQVKQLSTQQISTLMSMYTPMPTSVGNLPVLDSLPTTFSAAGYLAANPASTYQCLAANAARQTYAVTNQGTANVYLDMDGPTTATKRFVTIVPNGTYVSDFNYVGAVFIWSSNATAQPCEVRELIQ